jgi:hypothetical protein
VTAFTFSVFVNVERFGNGAQVANCLGLTPRVYMSGSLITVRRDNKKGKRIPAGAAGTGGVGAGPVKGRRGVKGAV